MCGRYQAVDSGGQRDIEQWLQQAERIAYSLELPLRIQGDVCPGDIAPVIAPNASKRELGCFPMRWGFPHPGKGMLVFNTRQETAEQKALFATSVYERRCAIPASLYYEWYKNPLGKKEKYCFSSPRGEALFMAGLYVRSSDYKKLPSFSILTRDALPELAYLHPRMPVLLPKELISLWLDPKTPFSQLLQKAPPLETRRG